MPVEPQRIATVPGLPELEWIAGPVVREDLSAVCAWGETNAVETLRRRVAPDDAGATRADVAARVNHRGFATDVARAVGCALPGAGMVDNADDLERHVRDHSRVSTFVVKRAHGSAGRGFVVFGRDEFESVSQRLRRMLRGPDSLLIEPWRRRSLDFAACGRVEADGVRLVSLHRQFLTHHGRFIGVQIAPDARWLPQPVRARMIEVFEQVGVRLKAEGYTGPFGIDGYVFDDDGRDGTQFLSDLNARITMGLLAHRLIERLSPAPCATLHVTGLAGRLPAPSAGIIPLLRPGREDWTAAWLEMHAIR